MKTRYIDLIEQTFEWPQEEFDVEEEELTFHGINMMDLVKQYGTPLKFSYLPKISENIKRSKRMFHVAMAKAEYKGTYHYCYCTKSSHFAHVLNEALKNDIHLETSSAFDINIIETLQQEGLVQKDQFIVCNGYKLPNYIENIKNLIANGFENVLPIIDNVGEFDTWSNTVEKPMRIGIRIASEEEPKFEFYTSRLGIGYKSILPFYLEKVKNNPNFELKMLHFFVNTGISDTAYYWNELTKCLRVYIELKKHCPSLNSLNIGGGMPIKNSLSFDFDYEYIVEEIIQQIKNQCNEAGVDEPNIFTEFGSYTVGESGGVLFQIMDQKRQNDRERWNMIDSSFMTTLPDSWAVSKRFVMLPLNQWHSNYERVFLGGLSCDSDDYYNSEQHTNAIYMPRFRLEKPLYIGFFHTGAYQESIGGFGGIQHCLIPNPKYILLDRDENGEIHSRLFTKEQSYKSMLKTLGY
jgi:arginine decarboxylase